MKALLLLLTSCKIVETPEVTYSLNASADLEPDLDRALGGWATLGIFRDDSAPNPIYVERVPDGAIPADGTANRANRLVRVKNSLKGIRLLVVLAHEVGHVVLDTANHTFGCGIMGGSDTFPCDEDIVLACTTFPTLEVCL